MHLDTDLGSDPDDACALALLLGRPDVELVGITTTIDPGGTRAGCVARVLELAGRTDVPVAAGAEASLTTGERLLPDLDVAHWPAGPPAPRPSPASAAGALLRDGVDAGATIVGIGPQTNLAQLDDAHLARARVVVMGGWLRPAVPGLPPWGPERDFNVQHDPHAAATVAARVPDLTLVPITVTLATHLRRADLPRLRAAGPLGELLARQGEAYARDRGHARLAHEHRGLPDDLVNFHHDPLTCAVAVGWDGVTVQDVRLRCGIDRDGVLRWREDRLGRPVRVVTDVDGARFGEAWLDGVTGGAR